MKFILKEKEIEYCKSAFLNSKSSSHEDAIIKAITMIGDINTSREFPSVWEKDGEYIVVRLKDREYPDYFGFKEVDDYSSLRKRIINKS